MKLIFKTLVIATRNPAKVIRYKDILSPYAGEVIGLPGMLVGKPAERGETAEENAEIKATYYARQTGCAVFSEDEALYVDFLPLKAQPGVHVRRINGNDEASDEQLLAHWESVIAQVPAEARTGKWHIAYCLTWPDGLVKTFGLDFPITFFSPSSARKIPGWPMSSLEGPLGFNKPHSELTQAERNQLNHIIDQALARAIEEIVLQG